MIIILVDQRSTPKEHNKKKQEQIKEACIKKVVI